MLMKLTRNYGANPSFSASSNQIKDLISSSPESPLFSPVYALFTRSPAEEDDDCYSGRIRAVQVNEKGQLRLSRRTLLPDDNTGRSSTKDQKVSFKEEKTSVPIPAAQEMPRKSSENSKPNEKKAEQSNSSKVDKNSVKHVVNKDKQKKNDDKSVSGISTTDESGTINGEATVR